MNIKEYLKDHSERDLMNRIYQMIYTVNPKVTRLNFDAAEEKLKSMGIKIEEEDYIARAWQELSGMDFREIKDRLIHYDNAIEYFKKGIEKKDKLIKQLQEKLNE